MFPLAPGRSGPKLAECSLHLEGFIGSCSAFEDVYSRTVASKLYAEDPSPFPLGEFPEILPYRNLCADRLRLAGRGEWQLEKHLDGCLWLPFRESKFLRHGQSINGAVLSALHSENKDECLKLAKLWELNGFLALYDPSVVPGYFCEASLVYRSSSTDCLIGERRLPNASGLKIGGLSQHLPPGHLAHFWEKRGSEDDFEGTLAHRIYCEKASKFVPRDRLELGDDFGGKRRRGLLSRNFVCPASQSLFQGDHFGVGFVLVGHEGLLSSFGLLKEVDRPKGHSLVPFGPRWAGLIIDDVIVSEVEPVISLKTDSFAFWVLAEARNVYAGEGPLRSDEEDC